MLREMFKPAKDIGDIPEFLYQHIEIDIKNLQKCLDRSLEDVCLLIHSVINSMMTVRRNGMWCLISCYHRN